jgi:quinol monooxygenase YgiN
VSVTVVFEITAKPDQAAALADAFKQILPDTRSYDGCEGLSFHQNVDDPASLLIYEKWVSRAKYEAYLGWRSERGDVAALGPMVTAPPNIRYFDDVEV